MCNQRQSRNNLLIVLLAMLGTQSCIDQKDFEFDNLAGVKASPSVAIPLMYGSLSIEDLLPLEELENVNTDSDGLIYLTYSDTLRSTSIHDHFLLPQLNLNESYPVGLGSLVSGGQQVIIEDQQFLDLKFPEADFEEIRLKNGQLKITAGHSLEKEVKLFVSFPTLKKNGIPLTMQASLPQGSDFNKTKLEADLKGYTADLSDYAAGENFLPVDIKAEFNKQENEVLNPADQVTLQLQIGDLKYNLLTGNLGQPVVELPESEIPISIFESLFSKGKFGLKNPELSFKVLNSNGAPLRVTTNTLQARNSKGKLVNIQINPSSPIDVAYPTTFGKTSTTELEIKNVGEIIDLAPSFIDYSLSGQLNMTPTTGQNFLTDSSEVAVVLDANVPLWGYHEGFSLADTLDMGLEFEDAVVKEASLRLLIENEFPLEAQVQIEFINDQYDVLETLFTGDYKTLLPASTVNNQGDLVSAGKYTGGDIEITSERFERILKANKMIVKAMLFTSRNADGSHPHVKIKSGYKLNVNLGVKTTTNLTVKL